MNNLENTIALIIDNVKDLEKWSVENDDLFLEEAIIMRDMAESVKDQTWKIGVKRGK